VIRVMIVEDDPPAAALLTRLVKRACPQVSIEIKTEAISALEHWRDVGADVVLLDWGLPGMSGIEVLKLIRRSHRRAVCVLITGYSDRDKILAARAQQVDAYILKPFEAQNVIDTLARIFSALSDQPPAQETSAASLGERVSQHLSQGGLGLPIDHGLAKTAVRLRGLDAEERIGVLRRCQTDPALLFRILSLANTGHHVQAAGSLETFEAALRRIGLGEFIGLVVELSLYPGSHLKEDFLIAKRLEFQREAMSLMGIVSKLRQHVEFDLTACRSACLLGRLGEFSLLSIIQSWVDDGHSLDQAACAQVLTQHGVRASEQVRAQWPIPHRLRERIGAIEALPEGIVHREPLIMRIAGLIHRGDPQRELPRLLSRFGLGAGIMEGNRP
jgi:CheY-like chemotaxis protein